MRPTIITPRRNKAFSSFSATLITAVLTVLLQASLGVSSCHAVAPSETAGEKLFDGKSLDGWDGDPRLWSVRDGVIHGETTPAQKATGNTFLILERDVPDNFELRITFRCNATNNSGIQYRSTRITDKSAKNPWVVRGYQHELRNEIGFPNVPGFIYDEGGKRRRICLVGEKAIMKDGEKQVVETLITPEAFVELFRLDDWNDVVIKANGNHVQHFLNGTKILDFTDSPELARLDGVIALQLHAGKPMWAEFKDIELVAISN
ncbi:MAG: DUF1080 domain-containing protein [Planctomycetota bacterium]